MKYLLFVVAIGIVIVYILFFTNVLIAYYHKWNQKRKQEIKDKEADRIARKNEIIKMVAAQHRNMKNTYNFPVWYTLDTLQKDLIKLWLKEKMFEQHRDLFNTIINDDRYNDDDKKTLSKCRDTYITMRKYFKNRLIERSYKKGEGDIVNMFDDGLE